MRVEARDGGTLERRLPRIALYAGWTIVIGVLWVLAPGSLPAVGAGLHWVTGICAVVMAMATWSSPARVGRIPVRWGALCVAAAFLGLAALQTWAVLR